MSITVVEGFLYSDEGSVVHHGFISDNKPDVGALLKRALVRFCANSSILNYKIVPFHFNNEFGLAAVQHPPRH